MEIFFYINHTLFCFNIDLFKVEFVKIIILQNIKAFTLYIEIYKANKHIIFFLYCTKGFKKNTWLTALGKT